MAEARLVLGQLLPPAATLQALYTVPAATQAVVSTIVVCEQAGANTTYSISVAIGGAADVPLQYIAFNAPLQPNETKGFTLGVTLGIADVIRVKSVSGQVSFSAFGVQLT